MKTPTIVSYYTSNYQEENIRFINSLNKFGLDHHVEAIESLGQWIDNIYFRAQFIMDMLTFFRSDIVWLDIDAEILRYPVLFRHFPGDFGAHYFTWPSGTREVMGGTMYFRYCNETIDLVKDWCWLNKTLAKKPRSQLVLNEALVTFRGQIVEFPEEYTYIPRFMPNVKEPVIMHHQASSKNRRPDLEGFSPEDVSFEYKGDR